MVLASTAVATASTTAPTAVSTTTPLVVTLTKAATASTVLTAAMREHALDLTIINGLNIQAAMAVPANTSVDSAAAVSATARAAAAPVDGGKT
jgi:hypothetical protein